MAQLDAATRSFAAKIAEEKDETTGLEPLRAAKAVVRFAENPKKSVVRAIVRASMEKNGHVSPIKLFELLNHNFDEDWWIWEPETLWRTLAVEKGFVVDDELKNLVLAVQTTITTNYPFEHWHAFEKVGQAFNLNPVDFTIVQPLEPTEVSYTVFMLRKLRPQQEFDHEVLGYIAACGIDAGLTFMPQELFGNGVQAVHYKIQDDHSGVGVQTANAWPAKPSPDQPIALRIQLARLHEIKDYVTERL